MWVETAGQAGLDQRTTQSSGDPFAAMVIQDKHTDLNPA